MSINEDPCLHLLFTNPPKGTMDCFHERFYFFLSEVILEGRSLEYFLSICFLSVHLKLFDHYIKTIGYEI